jgi:pimeloyl-ACP methyl ester carboxylesterase
MPGFGFSEAPRTSGMGVSRIADRWLELMRQLGYERFGVQGGDWGAWVGIALTRRAPERIMGAHLNYVPARYLPAIQQPSTPEEHAYMLARQQWSEEEGGYIAIQATKPQTLGFALTDSPVGLAAWIAEKFHTWSDPNSMLTNDELLTNISLYWFTSSIFSSMCIYKEARRDVAETEWSTVSPVPVAVAKFPAEIPFPPRSHVSKYLKVTRWTEMASGGHFAALEAPHALAADIQAFFEIDKQGSA